MKSKWIFRVPCCLAVIAFFLAMTSPFLMAQNPDSEQISKLLSDARSQAATAEIDADTLVAYTRSAISWETHADKLEEMRLDVNRMGKTVAELQKLRPEGSPWQQVAIDRIYPLLRDMADELTATMDHLNKHKSDINMPPYWDYAHANYDVASRTASLINDLVEYGKAKENSATLQQKLELPAKAPGNN